MSEDIKLKPGTYKLKYSTKNPEADGRVKRDWRKDREWQAGRAFIVEVDEHITQLARDHLKASGVNMSLIPEDAVIRTRLRPADGGVSVYALYDNSEGYKALAPNLVPAEETPEALLSRLDISRRYNDWYFFLFLIKRMGAAWFEENWKEYLKSEEL